MAFITPHLYEGVCCFLTYISNLISIEYIMARKSDSGAKAKASVKET